MKPRKARPPRADKPLPIQVARSAARAERGTPQPQKDILMPKPAGFTLLEPFGPRDFTAHTHENDVYKHAEAMTRCGKAAIALIGGHSVDELQAALSRARRVYVSNLAQHIADRASA